MYPVRLTYLQLLTHDIVELVEGKSGDLVRFRFGCSTLRILSLLLFFVRCDDEKRGRGRGSDTLEKKQTKI